MTARWFLVARTLGSLQKKSVKEEIKIKKEELKTIKINNKGEMEVSSQEDGINDLVHLMNASLVKVKVDGR